MRTLLLAHLGATLVMVGTIWFVQVVHYPLFEFVGPREFGRYSTEHIRRTTWLVLPFMGVEGGSGLLLLPLRPQVVPAWSVWLGAILLLVLWTCTAVLQVPRHYALSRGFDPAAHRALVLSNWLRTIAWTARGGLALWMVGQVMRC